MPGFEGVCTLPASSLRKGWLRGQWSLGFADLNFKPPFTILLLLSRFSRVRLCATPKMAAHQTLPSLGFSRQEHWNGLPFPSPMHESEDAQSYLTLSDPMDCSLPGSCIHGIFQARVREWGTFAFSEIHATNVNSIFFSLAF